MKVFKNLYEYRELLKSSIKKDVGGKYKNSVLGVLWSFLYPLLQIAVYAIVFPLIMRSNMENYTGNILKKVYFPREILPISVVTSEAVNFVISTIIILAFVLGTGMGLTWYVIFYPVILLIQYILLIGISLFVSSITVYFRDLQHFIGIALQLLFYATPIVYATNIIPESYQWILRLNPMTFIIDGYRSIFYYQQQPDFISLGITLLVSLILCVVGYLLFSKLQKRFAEEL